VTVHERLRATGLADRCRRPEFDPATQEQLLRVHAPGHVEHVRRFAEAGGGRIEVDTVVSPESYKVALSAAGAGIAAVDAVIEGAERRALCLVRPPGHHARPGHPMGFCLFNNVAVAAQHALDRHRLDRILVVDWDVHHGNGTQEIFYTSARVFYLSIHRWPFYPGTGAVHETGAGDGLGYTLNVPVTFGTSREDYLKRFQAALEQAAEKCRPQLVLLSAGFDAHARDPIGSLELETEDFEPLTRGPMAVADEYADGRLVSMLEGGYDLEALADSVELHLRTFLGAEQPVGR
jgi:acetoin utilization deacetylase AcuC-like enzyme